jgi:hypothetical protein
MIRIPMNMIIFARKKLLDIFSEGAVSSDASRPPFFINKNKGLLHAVLYFTYNPILL